MLYVQRRSVSSAALLFAFLSALLAGTSPVYGAEPERTYFWSDAVPTPSCYASRDGGTREIGFSVDGKRVAESLPACDEAVKQQVVVQVDGKYLHTVYGSGSEPFIENGRTMIPLKALADAFGFEVEWEQREQRITLTRDDVQTILTIGSSELRVNGQSRTFADAVPAIRNDTTFLPVRPLAEILGANVHWDPATRTAVFRDDPS